MSKGTAIDRVLTFYRTASHDTVRVTHQLAQEIIAERGIGRKVTGTGQRRSRKPKAAPAAATSAAAASAS